MMNSPTTLSAPTAPNARGRHRAGLAAAACGLLLLLAATAGSAALRAELERDTVQEGETLTLSLAADGMATGGQPDLAPLQKDFRVLGTSVSRQMNMVNGRSSSQTRWLVRLQPMRVGKLVVPALALGDDKSEPLAVEVTANAPQAASPANAHVFVEVEVPKDTGAFHVGQQIPYTVRLYFDDALRDGGLDAPKAGDSMIEQIGKEQRSTTVRNGRTLRMIERRYAITPDKSGPLYIPPVAFSGLVAGGPGARPGGGGMSAMMEELLRNSPFANDPRFRDPFAGVPGFADPGRPITVQSEAITLEIQPRPGAAPKGWLPAEQVTLTDSWSEHPPEFKVGEPVTRTITIETTGLTGAQIPEIAIAAPANARLYRETSNSQSGGYGETLRGISRQSLTYIPTAEGTLAIPEVALDWWNTKTDTAARAMLPPRQFAVLPGVAGSQPAIGTTPAPAVSALPAPGSAQTATQPAAATPFATALTERLRKHWQALAIGGALLLATIAALMLGGRLRRARSPVASPPAGGAAPSSTPPTTDAVLRSLRAACATSDARAAAAALLALGRARWPDDPPGTLGALAARLERGGDEIRALDRSLYARAAAPWSGAALAAAFRDGVQERQPASRPAGDGLDPLYQ